MSYSPLEEKGHPIPGVPHIDVTMQPHIETVTIGPHIEALPVKGRDLDKEKEQLNSILDSVIDIYKHGPRSYKCSEASQILMKMAIDFDLSHLPQKLCNKYINLAREEEVPQDPYNPMLKSDVAMLLECAVYYIKAAILFSDELYYDREEIERKLRFSLECDS